MALWFIDDEGGYWRLSKFAGGLQAELPNGQGFGSVMPIVQAEGQFGIQQLPHEMCLILDRFDVVKVDRMSWSDFDYLRKGVIEVMKYILAQQNQNAKAIESAGKESKEEINTNKVESE